MTGGMGAQDIIVMKSARTLACMAWQVTAAPYSLFQNMPDARVA